MTLVLIGSLGSTAAMWKPQAPLGPARAFELPGHGAEPLGDDVSVDGMAQRVLDGVEGPFSLVGLSLGGAVAMRVAAAAPDRVEKLVLACTSPDFGDPERWLERAALVRREGVEAVVDAIMGRWFTPSYPDVERWRAMFLSIDREGYAACCEALAGWDGRDDLRRIEAPTLAIAGADDPTSPPAHADEMASLVRDGRAASIEGARHLANVERADEFNRLVKEHV